MRTRAPIEAPSEAMLGEHLLNPRAAQAAASARYARPYTLRYARWNALGSE